MTPIQQHETELRAMMERAGLVVEAESVYDLAASAPGHSLGMCYDDDARQTHCVHVTPTYDTSRAEHPDPRVALRHCLEMAGLLEDRPPLTPNELETWLRTNHGPPLVNHSVPTWLVRGRRLERLDDEWCYRGMMVHARDMGAMLWTDKRFPCE
jgi:hypothetical protein